MSSLGRLFSRRPTAPHKASRPFARRLSRYEPRVFRGEDAIDRPPPDVVPEYKPPSVFAEHRGIAIVFGIVCLALAAYWIKSLRTARNLPPPVQSVYVEVVPQKGAPTPR